MCRTLALLFETESHCLELARLELAVEARLILIRLCLLHAGIKGVHQHSEEDSLQNFLCVHSGDSDSPIPKVP